MNEILEIITDEETKKIKKLFERKNSLIELLSMIDNNSNLYDRLLNDFTETSVLMDNWWKEIEKKYSLKSINGYVWEINFESNEISLKRDNAKTNSKD